MTQRPGDFDSDAAEPVQPPVSYFEGFGIVATTLGLIIASLASPLPIWGKLLAATFSLCLGVSYALCTDPVRREKLATFIEATDVTLLYQWCGHQLLAGIWARVCPGAAEGPVELSKLKFPQLLGRALSPQTHDTAFILALFYPIALPLLIWAISGQATGFDAASGGQILQEQRQGGEVHVLLLVSLLLWGLSWFPMAQTAPYDELHINRARLAAVFAASLPLLLLIAGSPNLGQAEITALLAVPVAAAATTAFPAAAAFIFVVTGVFSLVFEYKLGASYLFAFAVSILYYWLDGRGNRRLARALIWVVAIAGFWTLSRVLASNGVWLSEAQQILLVFFVLLPLINGLMDFLSYGVTLALITRGQRRGARPLVLGLVDLGVAMIMFCLLGVFLVGALTLFAWTFGAPIFDLDAYFHVLKSPEGWKQEWWVPAMVFWTLLPTMAHACLGALSAQALVPMKLRAPLAAAVRNDRDWWVQRLAAPVGVAILWTGILALIGTVIWALLWGLPVLFLAHSIPYFYLDRLHVLAFELGAL